METATDQSKMIMFGGSTGNTTVTVIGSLFFLDLTTLTWSKGVDAPQAESRLGHACAVNGDSFIVWGGKYFFLKKMNDVSFYEKSTR